MKICVGGNALEIGPHENRRERNETGQGAVGLCQSSSAKDHQEHSWSSTDRLSYSLQRERDARHGEPRASQYEC